MLKTINYYLQKVNFYLETNKQAEEAPPSVATTHIYIKHKKKLHEKHWKKLQLPTATTTAQTSAATLVANNNSQSK